MRLIDKTKLLQQLSVFEKMHKDIKEVSTIIDIIALTHEEYAIPIEWIEKYAKRTSKKCCHCATAIWEMLEDWEIENGTRNTDS